MTHSGALLDFPYNLVDTKSLALICEINDLPQDRMSELVVASRKLD